MINKEMIEAQLQQLRDMGMTEDMISTYRQQIEASMQAAEQMGVNIGEAYDTDLDSSITMAETTDLTPEQQWGVACGADLAVLNDHPLNTLETGSSKSMMRSQLSDWWGVDGRDELLAMFAYLEEGGHRHRFAHVDTALRMSATAEAKKYLEDNLDDDFDTAMEWFHNMREAYEQFAEDGLLPENAPLPNLMAWDYVRIINLCRNGFDAKYIKKEEALETIMKTAKQIQKEYSSWKELSISYQFGRYIWGGDDQYDMLKEGMEDLLSDENSPWVNLNFNDEL